jgi:hypothetical protein
MRWCLLVALLGAGTSASISSAAAVELSPAAPVVAVGGASFHSNNWSGYSMTGGPFTVVTGTFDVPSLSATPGAATTSEWVGVDGGPGHRGSLIQAGVTESYSASTHLVNTYAWWEILPSSETIIPLSVASGDQVTVTIGQIAPGLWRIWVIDDTTGEVYFIDQAYSGAGGEADWIVEAPTSAPSRIIDTLGQYAPVTFSNLAVTGAAASLVEWGMVQGGTLVSAPSALTEAGFSIGYTAANPPGVQLP